MEIYTQERFFSVTEDWCRTGEIEYTDEINQVIEDFKGITANAEETYNSSSVDIPVEEIEKALNHLDPDCSYNRWRNVGFALADYFDNREKAEEFFREWSKQGAKYDDSADYHISKIINEGGRKRGEDDSITVGTLIYYAKQEGFEPAFGGGNNSTNTRIQERQGRYYIQNEGGEKEISSFTLEPKYITKSDMGRKKVSMDVIPASGTDERVNVEVRMEDWNEPRDFRKEVCVGETTTFKGGRGALNELREHVLGQDIDRKKKTKKVGVHGEEIVTPNQTYRLDEGCEEYKYSQNGSQIERKWEIELGREYDEEEVKGILKHLPHARTPERFIPVLGWFYSSLLAPKIREWEGELPYLMVMGETEVGKTATLGYLQRMLGLSGTPNSCTDSEFASMRLFSVTTNIPVWLDEYKPSDMSSRDKNQLHELIRKNTRGAEESKGNTSFETVSYDLVSPMVLSGEQCVQGSAEKRRAVQTQFRNKPTKEGSDYKKNWKKLEGGSYHEGGETVFADGYDPHEHAKALYDYLLEIIRDKDIEDRWKDAKSDVKDIGSGYSLSELDITKCAMIKVGVDMYRDMAERHGVKPQISEEEEKDALQYIIGESTNESRGTHLDEFMLLMRRVAEEDMLDYKKDLKYQRNDREKNLKIKVRSIHNTISKYLKDHDLDGHDLMEPEDYKSRMKDMEDDDDSYIKEVGKKDRDINRCVVVDEDEVEEEIEEYERIGETQPIRNHHDVDTTQF